MSDLIDKWHCRQTVYSKLIREVLEVNPVAHHISKRMELIRDQQKQTECENLERRITSPEPSQNSTVAVAATTATSTAAATAATASAAAITTTATIANMIAIFL